MKYFVTVNGRDHQVEVVERAGDLVVSIDGKVTDSHYHEVDRHGQIALLMEGKGYAVSVAGKRNELDVTLAGHAYEVDIEDERERAAHAAERERHKGGGVVKAVMPGVLVEINVAVGDTVAEGQPLLILEAMKMQNEIGAPGEGVVKRIFVSQGEAVAAGAKLVELEALPEE